MTASQVPAPSPPDDAQQLDSAQQLDKEIAATRERLGDAVEQLVARLDVKAQARASANRAGRQLSDHARRIRNQAVAGAARVRGQLADDGGAATGDKPAGQRPLQLAVAAGALALVAVLVAVRLHRNGRGGNGA
jgi:hypothetical protein